MIFAIDSVVWEWYRYSYI